RASMTNLRGFFREPRTERPRIPLRSPPWYTGVYVRNIVLPSRWQSPCWQALLPDSTFATILAALGAADPSSAARRARGRLRRDVRADQKTRQQRSALSAAVRASQRRRPAPSL